MMNTILLTAEITLVGQSKRMIKAAACNTYNYYVGFTKLPSINQNIPKIVFACECIQVATCWQPKGSKIHGYESSMHACAYRRPLPTMPCSCAHEQKA